MTKSKLSLLAAAAAALVAAAAVAQSSDSNPRWLRKPTPEELFAVFPSAAIEQGIDGKAVIECEAAPDGVLRGCRVVSETPPGMGFGAAALALAPQFKLSPAMRDGKPTSSTVRIPINFDGPGSSKVSADRIPRSEGSGPKTITRMPWAAAPTRADVAAAYPEKATGEGLVMFDCVVAKDGGLERCAMMKEEPKGKGFARSARALTGKFRALSTEIGGQTIVGMHVLLTVRFDPPGAPPTGIFRDPEWIGVPDGTAVPYPEAARAAGVKKGRGVVDCLLDSTGRLTDCRLVSEEPAGLGFGDAALKMAPAFRVNPWTAEGRPVDGQRIKLPVGFSDEPAAPAPAAK